MKLAKLLGLTAAPFALLAAQPVLADNHVTSAPAHGPALWKVADADTTIYLFGTVHVLPKDIVWYNPTIDAALTGSDILVTEIPMDPESEARLQELSLAMGMLPPGTTLRSLLSEEQMAQYEIALTKLGTMIEAQQLAAAPPEVRAKYEADKTAGLVPPPGDALAAQLDTFKPWQVALTLSILPLIQQGYDPTSGVEKVLMAKAPTKPTGALETIEFQLGVFDGLSQNSQIAFMMEAANGIDEVKPTLDRMVDAWAKGDADALAAIMNDGMSDPAVAEALLYRRNANWAEWIGTRLESPGTVFIAVGAGHLAGPKSVQDLLAQKGITASRVK